MVSSQSIYEIKDAAMANIEAIARLEEQLSHVAGEFNRIEEVVKETINEPSLEYPTLKVQTEKGKTTKISFPNSSSLAAEPIILDNYPFIPSSYNRPPQESLVQHFPTAHIDDLEERVNQPMAARHAHTQPFHTHSPNLSCSFCYHPSHRIDDCPFINHYMIEASNSYHECVQTTTFGSEEIVEEIFFEPSLEDPSGDRFDQIGCNLDLDKFLKQAVMFKEPSLEDPLE